MNYENICNALQSWPAPCDIIFDINASSFKGYPGAVLQIG